MLCHDTEFDAPVILVILVCFLYFYIDYLDVFKRFVIAICLGLLYSYHDIITFCDLQNTPLQLDSAEPPVACMTC